MAEKNSRLKRTGSTDDDERNRIVSYRAICTFFRFEILNAVVLL